MIIIPITCSTARVGGGSFKNRKPIGEAWLLWGMDGRASPLMDRKVVGVSGYLSVYLSLSPSPSPSLPTPLQGQSDNGQCAPLGDGKLRMAVVQRNVIGTSMLMRRQLTVLKIGVLEHSPRSKYAWLTWHCNTLGHPSQIWIRRVSPPTP